MTQLSKVRNDVRDVDKEKCLWKFKIDPTDGFPTVERRAVPKGRGKSGCALLPLKTDPGIIFYR